MTTNTYAQAYTEILELIKNMEPQLKNKIPVKLIQFFEQNKDKNYHFTLKSIEEDKNMGISQKTIDLLAMLELKYLANEKEKEILKASLNKNEEEYQRKLREKYNPNDIFKKRNNKRK